MTAMIRTAIPSMTERWERLPAISRELGRLALRFFEDRARLDVSMKGAQDWLTAADGAVEAAFREIIAATFPGDAVMGEEMGQGAGDAENLWIIDPIDGTANFMRGDRHWCISVGFVRRGMPEIGLIHAPSLNETFLARTGHGATLNGAPIKVAGTTEMARATVEFGWSTRLPHGDYLAIVDKLFAAGANVKRAGSGALGLAHVACGRTDAYGELHINSWDVAGGLVIAREAGAFVSDFCTGAWLTGGNPILVATPRIAAPFIATSGFSGAPGVAR